MPLLIASSLQQRTVLQIWHPPLRPGLPGGCIVPLRYFTHHTHYQSPDKTNHNDQRRHVADNQGSPRCQTVNLGSQLSRSVRVVFVIFGIIVCLERSLRVRFSIPTGWVKNAVQVGAREGRACGTTLCFLFEETPHVAPSLNPVSCVCRESGAARST